MIERPNPHWMIEVSGPMEQGREAVLAASDDLIGVLAASYGDAFRGRELHLGRIHHAKVWLFIARAGPPQHLAVGFSYVHLNGKRGATGVIPSFRRRGVGMALVKESLRLLPDQYAEVGARNDGYSRLLQDVGFQPVRTLPRAFDLLGPVLSPLVTEAKVTDEGVIYDRYSYRPPFRHNSYRMLVAGRPILAMNREAALRALGIMVKDQL